MVNWKSTNSSVSIVNVLVFFWFIVSVEKRRLVQIIHWYIEDAYRVHIEREKGTYANVIRARTVNSHSFVGPGPSTSTARYDSHLVKVVFFLHRITEACVEFG